MRPARTKLRRRCWTNWFVNGRCAVVSNAGVRHKRKSDRRGPAAFLFALSAHLLVFTVLLNTGVLVPIDVIKDMNVPQPLALSVTEDEIESLEETGAASKGEKSDNSTKAAAVEREMTEPLRFTAPPVLRKPDGQSPPVAPMPSAEQAWAELRAATASTNLAGNGSGSGAAGRAAYGSRGKALRGRGLAEHGGTKQTEQAVLDGLRWLASVQDLKPEQPENYGRWDGDGFMRGYLPRGNTENYYDYIARCADEGAARIQRDLGLTGLAVMAFTGAGHTRTEGEFSRTVAAALDFILRTQDERGCFFSVGTASNGDMYDHAIGLLALADYLAMTGETEFREPVERGVRFLIERQQDSGGWDYKCYPLAEDPPRSDLSITGFCLTAMLSARAAGVEIEHSAVRKVKAFLETSTYPDGRVMYANAGIGVRRESASMASVNLLSRRLLGQPMDEAIQQKQKAIIAQHPPDYSHAASIDNEPYQWYYTGMALILEGGEEWKKFNVALKRTLTDAQDKAKGPRKGSWPPSTYYGRDAGRVYSTALACLCLEVYYRYIPEFLQAESKDFAHMWGAPGARDE